LGITVQGGNNLFPTEPGKQWDDVIQSLEMEDGARSTNSKSRNREGGQKRGGRRVPCSQDYVVDPPIGRAGWGPGGHDGHMVPRVY